MIFMRRCVADLFSEHIIGAPSLWVQETTNYLSFISISHPYYPVPLLDTAEISYIDYPPFPEINVDVAMI